MRLPFLQVEADLIGHRGIVAASALNVGCAQLVGMVALMRAYALGLCADGAPTGLVPGASAARALASIAGWSGDADAMVRALADPTVALLEVLPDGIRVSGMEPYQVAHSKKEASKERMRRSRERRAALRATDAKVPRKTEKETEKKRKTEAPPQAPQGARDPREGDPCEEHQSPAAKPSPAAHLAASSFAAPPEPPKPGEWTLHVAVQVAYELVRPGKRYPWAPGSERKAIDALFGLCAESGVLEPQAQVQEIACRFGRALACTDEPELKTAFKRRAASLTGLADRECWAANDVPFEGEVLRLVNGVKKPTKVYLEPWPHAVWRAAA